MVAVCQSQGSRTFSALLLAVPWTAVGVTLGLSSVAPSFAQTYMFYPLLVGMVFLGLPHGALDHLVPTRSGLTWARRPLWVGLYLLAYAALASLYLGLWLLAPRTAFAGFLVLTVWHWGQGDQRFLELFWGRLRPTRWGAWVTLLVRGGLPIALPVMVFSETAKSFYHHAAAGLGLTPNVIALGSPLFTAVLATTLVLMLIAYLANAVCAAPSAAVLALDMFELVLLVALFAFVPAYLALGMYFIFWHSLRHLARLLSFLGPNREARDFAEKQPFRSLGQLVFDLLPLTLAALTLLWGLYLLNNSRVTTLEGFIALYLVLISALTVPHAVVVALIDVWNPRLTKG